MYAEQANSSGLDGIVLLAFWNGPNSKFSSLRFVNNFLYPINIFWLDHDGKEKFYATIPVSGQFPQATYTTHAWRIRETETKRLLGTYVGEEATIEMTKAAACLVHKGFSSGYNLSRRKEPSHWGKFRQRGEARGIAIRAFDCVCDKAVSRAEHIVTKMVENMPKALLNRMHQNAADVAIIGKDQVTSDMPMHTYLKGKPIDSQGNEPHRTFDCDARGCGGSWTVPTCSAGEENLTMNEDAWYPSENILVHEFAHSVMSIGMNEDQRQAVLGAYFNARANQLYKKDCYMMASADEYWAEGAQSWFEATIRTDVNDRINTRARLKRHDPMLATILEGTFGDGEWMYQNTSPAPLSFNYASRRAQPYIRILVAREQAITNMTLEAQQTIWYRKAANALSKDSLLKMQRKAARYSTCCLPYSVSKMVYSFGFWADDAATEKAT